MGVPLCFVAPFLLGTLFWFSCGMLFGWHSWIWFFLGMAALTIPLLIHLEWRTGGNFLGEAGRDFAKDSAWDGLAMLGLPFGSPALAIAAANPRAATAGFMELFLIGPRLLVPGVRHLALAARLRMVDTVRAARVMEKLLTASSAMVMKSLLEAWEQPQVLGFTIYWLAFYDWIGIGEKGQRIILFSESREALRSVSMNPASR